MMQYVWYGRGKGLPRGFCGKMSLEAIGTMGHGPWDLGTWSLEAIGTLGHGPGDLGTLSLQAIGTM